MSDLRPGDMNLARLLVRRPYRWTIYTVFFLTATASLYYRVGLGRTDQALPSYGAFLSIYGVGMAFASRDIRCRIVYSCFGVLVAAAFTRWLFAEHARAVGLVEVAACLMLLAALMSLSRDERFLSKGAVLQSGPSDHQEDSDA